MRPGVVPIVADSTFSSFGTSVTAMPDAGPKPPPRGRDKPPLVYILAAFGLLAGAFGAQHALATGVTLLAPRDAYVEAMAIHNAPLKRGVAPADFDKYSARTADARYDRRNAALPLAAVGLFLSTLLFGGCLRGMRGDPWGIAAWSLVATASIPYELISAALAWLTGADLARAVADAPSSLTMMKMQVTIDTMGEVVLAGIAVIYFGLCALYLRTPSVRRAFSDAGRTPPSA
jgi:hypothetical protein